MEALDNKPALGITKSEAEDINLEKVHSKYEPSEINIEDIDLEIKSVDLAIDNLSENTAKSTQTSVEWKEASTQSTTKELFESAIREIEEINELCESVEKGCQIDLPTQRDDDKEEVEILLQRDDGNEDSWEQFVQKKPNEEVNQCIAIDDLLEYVPLQAIEMVIDEVVTVDAPKDSATERKRMAKRLVWKMCEMTGIRDEKHGLNADGKFEVRDQTEYEDVLHVLRDIFSRFNVADSKQIHSAELLSHQVVNLRDFLAQHLDWISKSPGYIDEECRAGWVSLESAMDTVDRLQLLRCHIEVAFIKYKKQYESVAYEKESVNCINA